MSLELVVRAIKTQMPKADLDALRAFVVDDIYPCIRQLRELYNVFAKGLNDGSFDFGGVTFRVVTGVPTAADANGSFAFRIDGGAGTSIYHMEASVWVGRA